MDEWFTIFILACITADRIGWILGSNDPHDFIGVDYKVKTDAN